LAAVHERLTTSLETRTHLPFLMFSISNGKQEMLNIFFELFVNMDETRGISDSHGGEYEV
jgi:hypothetical protein